MKIHSSSSFRHWYKTEVKQYSAEDDRHDENFVGCTLRNEEGRILKSGFFEMYHGDKDEVDKYLPSVLDIAEDGQAIYEFLQNAADCGSTHFYTFYDDNYFVVINNGRQFERQGIKAILNIAQSDKKDEMLIGRLGIGFKLVHRLVGKNDGTRELVAARKGPVVFSWSRQEDLCDLVEGANLELLDDNAADNGLPHLFKILCTNFPASPCEEVLWLDGNKCIPFDENELTEMRICLKQCLAKVRDLSALQTGTIFFIQLGEGKRRLLDRNYNDLQKGIQFSMNMLRKLHFVQINDEIIEAIRLKLEMGKISRDTEAYHAIAAQTNNDINFSVGYCDTNYDDDNAYGQVDQLRSAANFYKFFPMGDECHKFAMLVHCDSFNIEANRRKLHDDDTNRRLLGEIAYFLQNRLDQYREAGDMEAFKRLYASILYSEVPHDNSKWLKEHFTDLLMAHLHKHLPTTTGFCDNADWVKVCDMRTPVELADVGLPDYHWFAFYSPRLIGHARSSSGLGLGKWGITDLIRHADNNALDNWIMSCDKETYTSFLEELDEALSLEPDPDLGKDHNPLTIKIRKLRLFRFADGDFRSYYDVVRREYDRVWYSLDKVEVNYSSKYLFRTKQNSVLDEQMNEMGLYMSDIPIDTYPNLMNVLNLPSLTNIQKWLGKRNVFYSENLSKLSCDEYEALRSAFQGFFKLNIPQYDMLDKSTAWNGLFKVGCKLSENAQKLQNHVASSEEILALIHFSQKNDEQFFDDFIVEQYGNKMIYRLLARVEPEQQCVAKGRLADIVKRNFEHLHILPKAIPEKDIIPSEGILSEDDLQDKLIKDNSFEEIARELAFAISLKHREAFLSRLKKFVVDLDGEYDKESYEYRVLDIACKCFVHKEDKSSDSSVGKRNLGDFIDKIYVAEKGYEYNLATELFGEKDGFEYEGFRYKVSELLPDRSQEGGKVDRLVDLFCQAGLNREELNKLICITEDADTSDLFASLMTERKVLSNAQQLGFVLNYVKNNPTESLKPFKVKTMDNCLHDLSKGTFYNLTASYLPKSHILAQEYGGLHKYVELPVLNVVNGPYIQDGHLVCTDFVDEGWTDDSAFEFLDMLHELWMDVPEELKNADKEKLFIDASLSRYISLPELLGFSLKNAVYPDEYAIAEEKLPGYAQEWLEEYDDSRKFLIDMGLSDSYSDLVKLRKYLSGQEPSIDKNLIFQCSQQQLCNTLQWFSNKMLKALDDKMLDILREMVSQVQDSTHSYDISDGLDFKGMLKSSQEWTDSSYKSWKEENGITVKLYNGQMRHEWVMSGSPIMTFYKDDYCFRNWVIILNKELPVPVTDMLHRIALEGCCPFLDMKTFSQLEKSELLLTKSRLNDTELELSRTQKRVAELEQGNASLMQRIAQLEQELSLYKK